MSRLNFRLIAGMDAGSYRCFLRWASELFPLGLVVVRPELDLNETGIATVEGLEPYVVSWTRRSEWPGTQLMEDEAEVIIFRLERDAVELLCRVADSLTDWQQPALPEDLCILRTVDDPVLITTAHEDFITLHLNEAELEGLRIRIPNLVLSQHPAGSPAPSDEAGG